MLKNQDNIILDFEGYIKVDYNATSFAEFFLLETSTSKVVRQSDLDSGLNLKGGKNMSYVVLDEQ